MRRTALLALATACLGCCLVALFDARAQTQQEEHAAGAAPPHHMRGWVHMQPKALWWPDPR